MQKDLDTQDIFCKLAPINNKIKSMVKLIDSQNNKMSVGINTLKYKGSKYVTYDKVSKEKDVNLDVYVKALGKKYFLVNK